MPLTKESILPPRTHNAPPDPLAEIKGNLAETHEPLAKRSAELAGIAERLPAEIDSDDFAAKVAEAIKQCSTFDKNSEAARKAAKEPHLEAGRVVDGFFLGLAAPVKTVKDRMTALLTAYQRKKAAEELARRVEAERLAKEEADRRAAEAQTAKQLDDAITAEAAANDARAALAAKPAELSRQRTDLGVVASLRQTWTFEVTDAAAVPRAYLSINESAIKTAIRTNTDKEGNCHLQIPGLRIYAITSSVVR